MAANPFEEMAREDGQKRAAAPKPPTSAPAPTNSRLIALPESQDWGDQVVGSTHHREMPLPLTTASLLGTATVFASVTEGAEVFSTDWRVSTIEPSLSPAELKRHFDEAIRVNYAPAQPGIHHGLLTISVAWADGHREVQTISLRGHAYPIDSLPSWPGPKKPKPGPVAIVEPAPTPGTDVDSSPDVGNTTFQGNLEVARLNTNTHLEAVMGSMQTGMHFTRDTALGFKAKHEDDSIWVTLATLAVSAGVGVLASKLGELLASKLAHMIVADLQGAGAVADPDIVKSAAKILEEPIKGAGEAGLKAAVQSGATTVMSPSAPVAEFFAGQERGINHLETSSKLELNTAYAELLLLAGKNPRLATSAMKSLGGAFQAQTEVAEQAQRHATASAWATFKARDGLGVERVNTDVGPRDVTNLAPARDWTYHGLKVPDRADGLLEIHGTLRGRTIKVRSARINGVSQTVADLLVDLDLKKIGMPLLINLNDGAAFVTVDEVGRVRASGALVLFTEDNVPTANEAQVHDRVQQVADEVLARSLKGWGIASLLTNDANIAKVKPP